MTPTDVAPDPRLATALRLHAEMSTAATADEALASFARHVQALLPLRGWADVLVDLGDAPRPRRAMAYRVMDRVWLDPPRDGSARPEIRRTAFWPDPATCPEERGGLVADLLDEATGPRVLEPLPAAATGDPVLGPMSDGIASVLAVPVYRGGRPAEWVLLLRERPGWAADEVRLAVQVANLLGTALELRQAVERAGALNRELAERVEEVGRVQRSILPRMDEPIRGLRTAVHYEPSRTAGGDYYDHRRFADGRIGLVVADVSGHGPGASVVMAMLRTAFGAYRAFRPRPITVVQDVNRVLREAVGGGTFVTAFLLALDVATGRAIYANCGHPPARVVRRDGRVEALDEDASLPLGIVDELEPCGGAVRLDPGDRVVLYTDGIVETPDPRGRMLGMDGLDRVLEGVPRDADADAVLRAVVAAADAHGGGAPLRDDRCVLVAERTPGRED